MHSVRALVVPNSLTTVRSLMAWYRGLYCLSNHSDINADAIENHIKHLPSKPYHAFKTYFIVIDQFEESSTKG